jgi:hypothetical protein
MQKQLRGLDTTLLLPLRMRMALFSLNIMKKPMLFGIVSRIEWEFPFLKFPFPVAECS